MDAVKWMSQGEMCVVPRRGSYSGPIGAPLITPLFPELQVARDQTFERQPRLLAERNLKLSNAAATRSMILTVSQPVKMARLR